MDSSTYRQLFGQLNKSCPIPHHNFPSHNQYSLETLLNVSTDFSSDADENHSKFLESFPCYQTFPYSAQKSCILFCGTRDTDDAAELLKKKKSWERKLKDLKVTNIDLAIKNIKKIKKGKTTRLPANLKKYIDHFKRDPEPMFSGNYNWLYTGGCLGCDTDCDGTILISADYFNKKHGFNLLQLNETHTKVNYKSFTQVKTQSPVLQINCKNKEGNLIICVRQKNQLSVFRRDKTEQDSLPVKLWRKKVLDTKLLTCADLEANSERIIVTDSSHDAHIFLNETKTKISGYSGKKFASDSNGSCWSQVAFGELGVYWAFKNCFAVLDIRDFDSGIQLKFNPKIATNNCEEISSFVPSQTNSNYIYLGTTHSVLQMDLRMQSPIQRWTHLLKNPPQFMRNINNGEKCEILFLQSQIVDEIMGLVNEYTVCGERVDFLSTSLPCLLKTVKESLKVAHFHGISLSPFVAKKVDFTVTGMQCLKNSRNEITLFTNNSGGDIFVSRIEKKSSDQFPTPEDEHEIVNSMADYESHCLNIAPRNLDNRNFEFVDLKPLLEELKRPVEEPQNSKLERENLETCWKYHEMYSLDSLLVCKDVLAQKILKLWGHCSHPLETEDELMSVDFKVREWMNKF